MLNEKKIEERLSQIEAAARLILNEVSNIRAMMDIKRVEKVSTSKMKFLQRRQRSLNKKSLTENPVLTKLQELDKKRSKKVIASYQNR